MKMEMELIFSARCSRGGLLILNTHMCKVPGGITIMVHTNPFPLVFSDSALSSQYPWMVYIKVIHENVSPVAMGLTSTYSQLIWGGMAMKRRC